MTVNPDLKGLATVSQASDVDAPGVLGPGARGFKPEMDRLRERMRGLGFSYNETDFDIFAEIVATVPGQGEGGGQVCVADDGGLTWTRDYLAEAAVVSAPGVCGQAADPADIAGSVVEAVTRAMALLRPAGAGRASHG